MEDRCAHVHKREHADKVGSWVGDGESIQIVDRSEDNGHMVKENQVTADTKLCSLVKLKGSVLSQVAKLQADEEGGQGRAVRRDVVLGPIHRKKKVESGDGHDGGVNRGNDLVAEMVLLLGIGF